MELPHNLILNQLTLSSNITMSNPCVLKTLENIVMILGNMTANNLTANQVLATLPQGFRPANEVQIAYFHNTTTRRLIISANGEITCSQGAISGSSTLHTNGLMFNVNDYYYNSSRGNNIPYGSTEG